MTRISELILHSSSELFGKNISITITIIIIGCLCVLFMIFYVLTLFLNSTYRPDNAQYPYNMILDRYIPLLATFSPTISITWLNPGKFSMLEKFVCILILHLCILLPIMFYWSKHRHWDNYTAYDKLPWKRWQSPELYLSITVGIIYLTLWGCLFSVLRYLRLRNEIDINPYITMNSLKIILILIATLPITLFIMISLYGKFLLLKKLLWHSFSQLMISLCIILLRNKIIFSFLEKIYYLSFLWITFMICHPFIYNRTYFRKKLHKLYLKPFPLIMFFFGGIIIELLITSGKLYYSIYLMTIFFVLRTITLILNNFCGLDNSWIEYCCYSDYINQKWKDPYYPRRFWLSFNDMRSEFNNYPLLNNDQQNRINTIISYYEQNRKIYRDRRIYIFTCLINHNATSIKHRIRLVYEKWTRIKTD